MRRAAILCPLLVLAFAGCTPDFEDEWQVIDLRILAIQADPPEVLLSSTSASIPPVQVTALVADPRLAAGAELDWELWACTADELGCDEASRRVLVAKSRSTLDAIKASVQLTPELLQAAALEDSFRGFGGIPVLVHLKVWGEGEAEPVEAIKRLVYAVHEAPRLQPPAPGTLGGSCGGVQACADGLTCGPDDTCLKVPNANPTITEVTADGDAIPASGLQVALSEEPVKLLPETPEADKETYWVLTFPDGGSRQLEEYLSYAYFVTSGDLSEANTGGKPNVFVDIKTVEDISTEWTPLERGTHTLWVVIRDDRGGTSWVSYPLIVQ